MRHLPQRLLAVELRTEIDRALRGDAPAERRAIALALGHPDGVRSQHVRHNLRPHRIDWLEARLRGRASVRSDRSRSLDSLEHEHDWRSFQTFGGLPMDERCWCGEKRT